MKKYAEEEMKMHGIFPVSPSAKLLIPPLRLYKVCSVIVIQTAMK